jgi:hypothetical protein
MGYENNYKKFFVSSDSISIFVSTMVLAESFAAGESA